MIVWEFCCLLPWEIPFRSGVIVSNLEFFCNENDIVYFLLTLLLVRWMFRFFCKDELGCMLGFIFEFNSSLPLFDYLTGSFWIFILILFGLYVDLSFFMIERKSSIFSSFVSLFSNYLERILPNLISSYFWIISSKEIYPSPNSLTSYTKSKHFFSSFNSYTSAVSNIISTLVSKSI